MLRLSSLAARSPVKNPPFFAGFQNGFPSNVTGYFVVGIRERLQAMEGDHVEPEVDARIDPVELRAALATTTRLLDIVDDAEGTRPLSRLEEVIRDYAADRVVERYFVNPSPQKRLIRQLSRSLSKSLELLRRLSPEYLVNIDITARHDASMSEVIPSVARLAKATDQFLSGYTPKRGVGADVPLEEAVRELIPLIEAKTGGQVMASMNKAKGLNVWSWAASYQHPCV